MINKKDSTWGKLKSFKLPNQTPNNRCRQHICVLCCTQKGNVLELLLVGLLCRLHVCNSHNTCHASTNSHTNISNRNSTSIDL